MQRIVGCSGRVRLLGLDALLVLTFSLWVAISHAAPNLASVHAAVVDLDTGETLIAKHADVSVPIASVTKLMTALVVAESGAPYGEWLTIKDWHTQQTKNAYSRLRITSQAKRGELLRIALMSSENLAAYNLAANHPQGYEAFIAAMNQQAQRLRMSSSTFADPTGLSVDNKASATDLIALLKAVDKHKTASGYSTTWQHTARFRKPRYALGYGNTNRLVASSRWQVELTKTGYLSESGRCLAMIVRVGGRRLAIALLNSKGSRSPLGDAGRIRRWLANGDPGRVAQAARDYERQVVRDLGL